MPVPDDQDIALVRDAHLNLHGKSITPETGLNRLPSWPNIRPDQKAVARHVISSACSNPIFSYRFSVEIGLQFMTLFPHAESGPAALSTARRHASTLPGSGFFIPSG